MCRDEVSNELNERGYNIVRLPRIGIEPLDVLGRDGYSMEKLGSIGEVWTSTAPLPTVGAPAPAVGIEGERSSDLDLGIGLKLLANALAGLGGGISLPSLSIAYKQAARVRFKFVNVESSSISPFALGKFLANGTLDMSNPFAAHYFGNDETQEYIIFDVLKSDSISVSATSFDGLEVGADIGILGGALGSNVKAKVGAAGASEITFQGTVKATFAFKLFEVFYVNGQWVPQGVGAGEDLSLAIGGDEAADDVFGKSVVLHAGRMVRLKS